MKTEKLNKKNLVIKKGFNAVREAKFWQNLASPFKLMNDIAKPGSYRNSQALPKDFRRMNINNNDL